MLKVSSVFRRLPWRQIVLCGVFAVFVSAAAVNIYSQKNSGESLPSLRGEEAVTQLKENGQYDSLMEAVEDARQKSVQNDEPDAPESAVGQTAKLIAADGASGDELGFSVAVSGDTAIVSAHKDDAPNTDQGSVYVFVRNGTVWTQQAQLTASDGATNDQFGYSTAIDGNTAVVGAHLADGAAVDQGAAYVFTRSGTIWTQQAKLFVADGEFDDRFGFSVSIGGDTAVVGAVLDNVGQNSNQGSVYVFTRSGTIWTQQQRLAGADSAANDQFGYSTAVSGNTLIVGAPLHLVGSNNNQGAAYVFVKNGATWTEQARLTATEGNFSDLFGYSVGISGETAVVGAFNSDVGANFDQGAAYVFTRSGAAWTQQQRLTATGGASNDNFGWSVGISGETIIVGAYVDNVGSNNDQGSAYIFTRNGTVWTQQQQLTAADGAADDFFGNSVAIAGGNIIVGANRDNINTNDDQGAAYNFRVLTPNWMLETKTTSDDGVFDDQFGISVGISGDTAIVGAYLDDVGTNGNQQGSAYIFIRNGATWTQQAQIFAADGAANDRFGVSVGISGDTAIVGAYQKDVGATDQGAAYIFTRSGTMWTQQQQLTASDGAAFDFFGYATAIDGNTAVVGAYADDVGANVEQGSAYIFTRVGTMWTQQAQLAATADGATDSAAGDQFGISVGISGNTVVVGAFLDNILINADQGSAYIFVRNGATWTQQAKLQAMLGSGAANDRFGFSVAVGGDTAIVGVFFDDVGQNGNQGSAYIFTRSGTTWTQQAQLLADDGAADDRFGSSVGISGETVVIGAIFDDVGANFDQGSAYVFERNGTTWTQKTKLIDNNGASNDLFGSSAAISGDKIVVGSPNNETLPSAELDQGAVLFFVNTPLVPTAANISIAGRITADGAALRNASVRLTNESGEILTARTGSFGRYRFENLPAGQIYVVSIEPGRYTFASQIVSATEDITELNFVAEN